MKKKSQKILMWSGIGLLLVVLIIGGSFVAVQQSILGSSLVEFDEQGKFWITSVNVINQEDVIFNYKASEEVLSDGTTLKPTQAVTLTISPEKNTCSYQMISHIDKKFLLPDIKYFLLSSPERSFLINIKDNQGGSVTIDALNVKPYTITDKDSNGGTLTILPQGGFLGKNDCPSSTDVVIYNNGDGYNYYDKSDFYVWKNGITILNTWSTLRNIFINKVDFNEIFSRGFKQNTLKINTNLNTILGEMESIGSGVLTLSADSNYFESIVIKPSTPKPVIDEIICSDFKTSSSSTLAVNVKNTNSQSGQVVITMTGNGLSFTPSSKRLGISKSPVSTQFIVNTGKIEMNSNVCAEVCAVSQISTNCDKKCDICKISSSVTNKCGDTNCDPITESFETCPQDCKNDINPIITCAENERLTLTEECGITCQLKITKPIAKYECVPENNYILYIVLGLGTLIAILLITQPKKPMQAIARPMSRGRK